MKNLKFVSSFILSLSLTGSPAWPWGEIAHRIIARNSAEFLPCGLKKLYDNHLSEFGYYSTVPDTAWRADAIRDWERSTHYMDFERFIISPVDDKFPTNPSAAKKLFKSDDPAKSFRTNGTLPWRVNQIQHLLTQEFQRAGQGKSNGSKIGILSGLLGHYVGQTVQPFHTTLDYDGVLKEQDGIHAYFETKIVEELALKKNLEGESLKIANRRTQQLRNIGGTKSAARMALNLMAHSYKRLGAICEIDRLYAVRRKAGVGTMADGTQFIMRWPASRTASSFSKILSEQLALGSVNLASMIEKSWVQAGKPVLKSIFSSLVRKPAFIKPSLR